MEQQRRISKISFQDKMIGPSPIEGEVLPLAVDMTHWEKDIINCNWLESLIIWSDAPI